MKGVVEEFSVGSRQLEGKVCRESFQSFKNCSDSLFKFHFLPHDHEPNVSRQGREGTADGRFLMHPAHKAADSATVVAESQEWA